MMNDATACCTYNHNITSKLITWHGLLEEQRTESGSQSSQTTCHWNQVYSVKMPVFF